MSSEDAELLLCRGVPQDGLIAGRCQNLFSVRRIDDAYVPGIREWIDRKDLGCRIHLVRADLEARIGDEDLLRVRRESDVDLARVKPSDEVESLAGRGVPQHSSLLRWCEETPHVRPGDDCLPIGRKRGGSNRPLE